MGPEPTMVERLQERIKAGREAREKAAQTGKTVAFKAIGVDEFGIIRGIGGAAGSPNKLDKDGEFLEKGDLCKLAFDFCSGNRVFKANHEEDIKCELVESFVGAPIVETKAGTRTLTIDEPLDLSEMAVVGIDTRKGNETHWFVSVRPSDPKMVELAKSGEVSGFSWGALVSKTEV